MAPEVGAGSKTGQGLGSWLLERLRRPGRSRARLELLERISLAPRQSLSLVEAEGRRFLVASSQDGSPAFFPLDAGRVAALPRHQAVRARVSW